MCVCVWPTNGENNHSDFSSIPPPPRTILPFCSLHTKLLLNFANIMHIFSQGVAGAETSKDAPSEKTVKVKQKYDFAGEEVE